MGWSEVAARRHARGLEREGWLERYPMTRGSGSLFVATRSGVRMAAIPVRPAGSPAPTWWAHLSACAWVAAWLTARGRPVQGCREVLADQSWSGEVRWLDRKGWHNSGHRPDLALELGGTRIAVEVELAQKSTERLKAILGLHARWWAAGKTGGVIYVCEDEGGCARVRRAAEQIGLRAGRGGGLRVEQLETMMAEALAAYESAPRNGAVPQVGRGRA